MKSHSYSKSFHPCLGFWALLNGNSNQNILFNHHIWHNKHTYKHKFQAYIGEKGHNLHILTMWFRYWNWMTSCSYCCISMVTLSTFQSTLFTFCGFSFSSLVESRKSSGAKFRFHNITTPYINGIFQVERNVSCFWLLCMQHISRIQMRIGRICFKICVMERLFEHSC